MEIQIHAPLAQWEAFSYGMENANNASQKREAIEINSVTAEMLAKLETLNAHMATRVKQTESPWLAVRNGMLAGLGGVLGATVVVGLLIAFLRPFERLNYVGPTLERLTRQLEKNDRK